MSVRLEDRVGDLERDDADQDTEIATLQEWLAGIERKLRTGSIRFSKIEKRLRGLEERLGIQASEVDA